MALMFVGSALIAKGGEGNAEQNSMDAQAKHADVGNQEERKKPREPEKDWTRQGPILELPTDTGRKDSTRGQIEVGEIAAVIGDVAILRAIGNRSERISQPMAGEGVFVDDQIEAGKASAVEIVWGMNGRLRLGSESILKILAQWEISEGEVVATQRNLQIEKGMARLRLRRNEYRPTPALVVAGKAVLLLGRGDAVIRREANGGCIMVLNGEAEVVWRQEGSSGRGNRVRLGKRQQLLLHDGSDGLPAPMEMSEADAAKAEESLRFSIDEDRQRLPPAPKLDLEMEGL